MSEPLEQLAARLRSAGYSLTKPRRLVFAALQGSEPQTIHQLVGDCPAIDRASVYRTVSLFEQLMIVQRLHLGWKYKLELTDEFLHHHHHLSCRKCGQIIALPEDPRLEQQLVAMAAHHDFQATDHQLEIRGYCAACRAAL